MRSGEQLTESEQVRCDHVEKVDGGIERVPVFRRGAMNLKKSWKREVSYCPAKMARRSPMKLRGLRKMRRIGARSTDERVEQIKRTTFVSVRGRRSRAECTQNHKIAARTSCRIPLICRAKIIL